MRRFGANIIIGFAVLLVTALAPGAAAARQTTWNVTPGGAFLGQGTITIGQMTCALSFQGSFFDSSGQGQIQTVQVTSCGGPLPLGYPSFRVPINMTATTYLESIDTVGAPLADFIIDLQGPCPVTFAGPDGPNDPADYVEALYQNESADMWWNSGVGGGLTVWDPLGCYDAESLPINWKFTVSPAQTIRPGE